MPLKKPTPVTTEKKQLIRGKTAYALPDRPSEQGYSADAIRKAIAGGLIDNDNSVVAEINRIVRENNEALDELNLKDKTYYGNDEPDPNEYNLWLAGNEENDNIIQMTFRNNSFEFIKEQNINEEVNNHETHECYVDQNQPTNEIEEVEYAQPVGDEFVIDNNQPLSNDSIDENQPTYNDFIDPNQPICE